MLSRPTETDLTPVLRAAELPMFFYRLYQDPFRRVLVEPTEDAAEPVHARREAVRRFFAAERS
jgi:hypothetical protein